MGVSRFKRTEDPTPQLGKGDFEFFYSGTAQVGDDDRIPAKSKRQDCYVDQLAGLVKRQNTGQDMLLDFYAGVTLLGTVTITASAGDKVEFTSTITRTLITAGTVCYMVIRQVGLGTVGVTVSGWMRVCR